jgi:hypothetical protein
VATLINTRETVRSLGALAAEYESAGLDSAAQAVREAAVRVAAAVGRDEAALTAEGNRARALARAVA